MKYFKYSLAGSIFTVSLFVAAIAHAQTTYCSSGSLPTDPNGSATYTYTNNQLCAQFATCQNVSQSQSATLDTAQTLASALGATVITEPQCLGPTVCFSEPVYELQFPNGYTVEAGYMAQVYDSGLTAQSQQVYQSVCGSTGGTGGGGGSGGGTGGTGGTGTGTSGLLSQLNLVTQTLTQTCTNTTNLTSPTPSGSTVSGNTFALTNLCNSVQGLVTNTIGLLNKIYTTGTNIPTSLGSGGYTTSTNTGNEIKTVTVDLLNVRSAPNLSAPAVKQYQKGFTFTAYSPVTGQSVDSIDKWWLTMDGTTLLYVWSGGTTP